MLCFCFLKLWQPVQQLLWTKPTITAKRQNKNWHLSWTVGRGYGWDWGMGFYLLYPIMLGLNQHISVWCSDVWLSTSLLPFQIPQRWETVPLFFLLAPMKSCGSDVDFSQVQQLQLLEVWIPISSLLFIQQLWRAVSIYIIVGTQINIWKLCPHISAIVFWGKEGTSDWVPG